nr:hypothetical protein CFP56_12032 [Quercus suber]
MSDSRPMGSGMWRSGSKASGHRNVADSRHASAAAAWLCSPMALLPHMDLMGVGKTALHSKYRSKYHVKEQKSGQGLPIESADLAFHTSDGPEQSSSSGGSSLHDLGQGAPTKGDGRGSDRSQNLCLEVDCAAQALRRGIRYAGDQIGIDAASCNRASVYPLGTDAAPEKARRPRMARLAAERQHSPRCVAGVRPNYSKGQPVPWKQLYMPSSLRLYPFDLSFIPSTVLLPTPIAPPPGRPHPAVRIYVAAVPIRGVVSSVTFVSASIVHRISAGQTCTGKRLLQISWTALDKEAKTEDVTALTTTTVLDDLRLQ